MSKLNFAMFMAGATVGSAATWLYLKKRYEQITQKEIDSVKAVYAEHRKAEYTTPDTDDVQDNKQYKADLAKTEQPLVTYVAKLRKQGYTNYIEYGKKNTTEEKDEGMTNAPYVISPDEFSESDNYTQISLTYYSKDNILADDEDEIIEDVEDTVGSDFVDHFGEYEDDSVFIRNDRLRCDYEICRDNRSFQEITGVDPDQED